MPEKQLGRWLVAASEGRACVKRKAGRAGGMGFQSERLCGLPAPGCLAAQTGGKALVLLQECCPWG